MAVYKANSVDPDQMLQYDAAYCCCSMTLHTAVSDLDLYCLQSPICPNTLQPLYNTVCYNTILDIIWFKVVSQKCIDYIEK